MSISIQDVQNALNTIISPSPLGDGSNVITLNEYSFVPVDTFVNLFINAEDMMAVSLLAVDAVNNYGYSTYINDWKTKGLIL